MSRGSGVFVAVEVGSSVAVCRRRGRGFRCGSRRAGWRRLRRYCIGCCLVRRRLGVAVAVGVAVGSAVAVLVDVGSVSGSLLGVAVAVFVAVVGSGMAAASKSASEPPEMLTGRRLPSRLLARILSPNSSVSSTGVVISHAPSSSTVAEIVSPRAMASSTTAPGKPCPLARSVSAASDR